MNDSPAQGRASSTPTIDPRDAATTAAPTRSRRPDFASLRPLLPYALAYRGRIVAALLALFVAALATLALPLAVRRVIDGGFGGEGGAVTGDALIDVYFGVLVLVVGVLALASSLRFYFVITLGDRIVADLRSAVFRHLAGLDVSFFDRTKSGEIVSRLTADTTLVKSAFGASASIALRNLMLFVGALVMMVITSPKLSGLVIGAIPFIVVPLVLSGRKVRDRSRLAQDRLAETSAFAVEAVGAARVMQAYGMEGATARHFSDASDVAYAASRDATLSRSILTGVAIFLVSASVVGILWYGAQQVIAGQMSGGRLSQFVLYAVFAASSLGQLSEVYGEVSQAAGAAGRIAEWLEVKPAIVAPANPKPMPMPPRGEVAFENVVFAYPGREDEPVLSSLSFSVRPGETVALVGPSGAGKSTILQLVSRFYDPRSGVVRIDGLDLREVDPKQARARIALVPQDPVVFGVSVRENIAYGREDATPDEVRRAAELAAAHDFIMALPQGYETLIGERGVTLSGGQRQRLALARAILRDAPILMLDEATSALDAESERAVQHALETVARGRTTLVVAHRLATVLKADRILVIDGGRIVEEGAHADLVAKGGLYARLARLQFATGALDEPAQA
jgi:ATP-binding cassette subfamily B protein